MTGVFWFAICGAMLAAGGVVWFALRNWKARQLAEEQRLADFMAATAGKARLAEASPATTAPVVHMVHPAPALPPAAGDGLALQKLLFEAAHKAGEAGEPALAIQLYARLLARYPASGFAGQAHAAVDAQKKKLAKG